MEFGDFKDREFRDVCEGMFDAMIDCGIGDNGIEHHEGRERAKEACDRAMRRIGDDMVKPMSGQAQRYVAMFRKRKSIGRDDVQRALDAYGDEHQAARAIIEHAHACGIKGFDATSDERLHFAFEAVKRSCSEMHFKRESGLIEDRDGYKRLLVAVSDWANWLKGYESFMGNAVAPLRIPPSEVGE